MIQGPQALIVLLIVLVLFGGSQLPKLARNLGRAQSELKRGLDESDAEARTGGSGETGQRSGPSG